MARPRNKEELLVAAEENFNKLYDLIDDKPPHTRDFSRELGGFS